MSKPRLLMWKRLFWFGAGAAVVLYGFLLPPVIADIEPGQFYSRLMYRFSPLYRLQPQEDSDRDGLPDRYEEESGTNLDTADTDGDGLSDYSELRKYRTDPCAADSDGDGIPDSEWGERREYTRTVRTITDLRRPFSLGDMDSFYQDVRLLTEVSEEVERFEIILYPEASELLNPAVYEPKENQYTAATYTKNIDHHMSEEVRKKVSGARTDLQVLMRLQHLLETFTYVDPHRDLGYTSDMPLQFDVFVSDERVRRGYSGLPAGASMDTVLETLFYASGMFRRRIHGACSSKATIRGALLRAAGLEELTVFAIPVFYTLEGDATKLRLREPWGRTFLDQDPDHPLIADHVYNLVKIGGRWIRVDRGNIDVGLNGPYIVIRKMHDQVYHDFSLWNSHTWTSRRPYIHHLIEEQEARYTPSE